MSVEHRQGGNKNIGGALVEKYYCEGVASVSKVLFGEALGWEVVNGNPITNTGLLLERGGVQFGEVVLIPQMVRTQMRGGRHISEACHAFWYKGDKDWGAFRISIPFSPIGFSNFIDPHDDGSGKAKWKDGRRKIVTYTPIGDNRQTLIVGNICVIAGESLPIESLQTHMVSDRYRNQFCVEHGIPETVSRAEIEDRIRFLRSNSRVLDGVDSRNPLVGLGRISEMESLVRSYIPGRWVRYDRDKPKLFNVGKLPDGTELYKSIYDEFVPAKEEELIRIRESLTHEDREVVLQVMRDEIKEKVEAMRGIAEAGREVKLEAMIKLLDERIERDGGVLVTFLYKYPCNITIRNTEARECVAEKICDIGIHAVDLPISDPARGLLRHLSEK